MLLHSAAEKTEKWIGGWNIDTVLIMPVLMLLLLWVGLAVDPGAVVAMSAALIFTSPLWLPVALAGLFWVTWIHYVRFVFWFRTERTLLHIELPPEVIKSPLAMEIFLAALWNTGNETTFIDRFWLGRGRPTWSLEIASNEGRIGFYIGLRKIMKDVVEAKIYGQFPEARITEVPDYAEEVKFNFDEYDMWCGEYKKPNAPDALPIKTYIDFEMDKNPDTPEIKTDPLSNLLELFATRGPGEYLWVQIIIRANAKEDWYGIQSGYDPFVEPAKKKIEELLIQSGQRTGALGAAMGSEEKIRPPTPLQFTSVESKQVEAIERQLTKLVFQCGIRCLYIGKKEVYRGITGASTFRLFDAYRNGYNELRGTRGMVGFDYPWEDFGDIRKRHIKKMFLANYKHRAYFHAPYDQVPTFLTTEELASIWHFPGSGVQTPALQRVPSRRAAAPSNLPL